MLNLNAKLIATTNPVMSKYLGLSGELEFTEDALAFFYTQTKFNFTFRTSLIQNYEDKDNILTLYTLNSIYTFEKLESNVIPITVQFSFDRQIVEDYLKGIKSKKFHCILDGGPLRGIESIVSFDKAMTRKEALNLITSSEIRDDVEEEIVKNIICASDDEGYLFQLKISTIENVLYIKQNEFEKVGLLGSLNKFMIARAMLKYQDEQYISYADALEFFKY